MAKLSTIFLAVLLAIPLVAADLVFSLDQTLTYPSSTWPVDVETADLDGDGDLDAVLACRHLKTLTWYEDIGAPEYYPQQLLSDAIDEISDIVLVDLDSDGDVDIVTCDVGYNTILWYENTTGQGDFASGQLIADNQVGIGHVAIADLDGDLDLDIVSPAEDIDVFAWFENDGAGQDQWQEHLISNLNSPSAVRSVDLDGDGDQDLVLASILRHDLEWWENADGLGSFVRHIINPNAGWIYRLLVTDIDMDQDDDCLVADIDGVISMYRNQGDASFEPAIIVDDIDHQIVKMMAANIKGDDRPEIIINSNTNRTFGYYSYDSASNSFGALTAVGNSIWSGRATVGDYNADGYIDILSVDREGPFQWMRNEHNSGSFQVGEVLMDFTWAAEELLAVDMDNDGDDEIFSALGEENKIVLYENVDGYGAFGDRVVVAPYAEGVASIQAFDVDEDGFLDVISAEPGASRLVWYRNESGSGDFSTLHSIDGGLSGPVDITLGDIDGDGHVDILLATRDAGIIGWYRNLPESDQFSEMGELPGALPNVKTVLVLDVDKDGDLDVFGASYHPYQVLMWENRGSGEFAASVYLSGVPSGIIASGDMDGDGYEDLVLVNDEYGGSVNWLRNLDGSGAFSDVHLLSEDISPKAGLVVTDINGDGDVDVCVSSWYGMYWLENMESGSSFVTHQLLHLPSSPGHRLITPDVDLDSLPDLVLSMGSRLQVYTNQGPHPRFIASYTPGAYPQTVNFYDQSTASDAALSIWEWDFDDGHYSTEPNPTHSYSGPGEYNVTLTLIDEDETYNAYTVPACVQIPIIYGDLNLDGLVTYSDAQMAAELSLVEEPLDVRQIDVGDVSLDGSISAFDAALMGQYCSDNLFGLPIDTGFISAGSGVLMADTIEYNQHESTALAITLHGPENAYSIQGKIKIYSYQCEIDSMSSDLAPQAFTYALDGDEVRFAMAALDGTLPESELFKIYFHLAENASSPLVRVRLVQAWINETELPGYQVIGWILNTVDLNHEEHKPDAFQLLGAYPNPFNSTTTIRYDIAEQSDVSLEIFDLAGSSIHELLNKRLGQGSYEINWQAIGPHGKHLSTGIYLVRLQANGYTGVKKITYLE